jgi:carbamoyl-phosphate synthase small subunit
MTVPEIGNYGVNALDSESDRPHVRGFVIEELSPVSSSWRSEETLDHYLKRFGVLGIQGIDTRALTRHLRDKGAMKGCVSTGSHFGGAGGCTCPEGLGVVGQDFVKEVTPEAAFDWDSESHSFPRLDDGARRGRGCRRWWQFQAFAACEAQNRGL